MTGSAQPVLSEEFSAGSFTRHSRASWIGSKLMQSIGMDEARLDAVHHAMWLRLLDDSSDGAVAKDECDRLASRILAVANLAEKASATGGSNAALVAVMRESGQSLDPMLAQNFLRLASSPIFWTALDAAGEAQAA